MLAAVALILMAATASAADSPGDFEKNLLPYLQAHCHRCHNGAKASGDFRIDTLSRNVGKENNPQWLEVMDRINSGEMPPRKEPKRPTAAESAKAVEWIAGRMRDGETARMASRAKVTYNRLTRDEYVNTVRDLIGVHYDARDPGNFLEDPEWHGFERIGSVLTLSPSNIEKYIAAAETILNEAYPPFPPPLRKGQKPPNLSEAPSPRSTRSRSANGTAKGSGKWAFSTRSGTKCGPATFTATRCSRIPCLKRESTR